MMRSSPASQANEAIIWGAAVMLGLVVGVAIAFGLWSQLHRSAEPGLLSAGVSSLSAGLALVGVAQRNGASRLFFISLAVGLPTAFFVGGPAFAAISPP
jgi:hypothetical protein